MTASNFAQKVCTLIALHKLICFVNLPVIRRAINDAPGDTLCIKSMRGSRNFHDFMRGGSNENGNFWSQTRGVQPPKNPEITFF